MRVQRDSGAATYTVRVLTRAASILRLLSGSRQPLTLDEIAARTCLHRATVYRILVTLEQEGLVERTGKPVRYTPGLQSVAMGMRALRGEMAAARTQPVLDMVADRTGETVGVFFRRGAESICVACAHGRHPVRYHLQVGAAFPLWVGAVGKILLAYMPDEDIRLLSKRMLGLPTGHRAAPALVDDDLTNELSRIRAAGFAVSTGELGADVVTVAVPVRYANQGTVAALGLAGPASRIADDRVPGLVEVLRDAADRASAAIAC